MSCSSPGGSPGICVRAVVYKRKRSYAHARAVEVLQPSPERIDPVADHPGVPWQVLPYERQLQIKRSQVEEALRRIGHLDGFELQEIVPALQEWRYRNKLEYSFGETEDGGLVCGFHVPAGANQVTAMGDCLLASEVGNHARRLVLDWCRAEGLSAWDRGRRRGRLPPAVEGKRAKPPSPAPDGRVRLRNLVVREGRGTGKLQVRLVTTDGDLDASGLALSLREALGDSLGGVLWTRSRSLAETTMGGETELVWGDGELPERLGVLDLRISAEAFFQTNTEMAELLYGIVGEYAGLQGWERVYDLYCGIGTIALTLAPRAGEVWGIELIEHAVADAIASAAAQRGHQRPLLRRRHPPGPVRARAAGRAPGRARRRPTPCRALQESRAAHRRGLPQADRLRLLQPHHARAQRRRSWSRPGGRSRVRPVDMFPQTHHIECVALFERAMVGPSLRPRSRACRARHAPCVLDLLDPRPAQGRCSPKFLARRRSRRIGFARCAPPPSASRRS